MIKDIQIYRREIRLDYREAFFKSMFTADRGIFDPIAWHETKDTFEVFINDSSFLNETAIAFFLGLQRNSKKTICFFFNEALQFDDTLFSNNEQSYVKLSYFTNGPLFCDLKPDETIHLEVIEGFDKRLIDYFKQGFINDPRLYENEPKMKPVYASVLREFDGLVEKNDFLFFRYNGEPAAFISGMRLGREFYYHLFYLTTLLWINSDLERAVKHTIVWHMMKWLNKKGGPYAAGINYSNKHSTNFWLKTGSKPYFLRFIPWPKV